MTMLVVKDLVKHFPIKGGIFGRTIGFVHAVNGVSFDVGEGETVGVVGESGCGKSTLGKLVVRLLKPDSGSIHFEGREITFLKRREMRKIRKKMQIIFQDPYSSLNPRMTVEDIIQEPLVVNKIGGKSERRARVKELLSTVGLKPDAATRYPHEFSGGQRQRICIARALALMPKFIVADEPVSALDVSIQGEIINLLMDLQDRFGLAYLFIAHDLKVVTQISSKIIVMYLGKIMEVFESSKLFDARHPYTQALVSAIPVLDPTKKKGRIILSGDVPSPINPPRGCPFHPRCKYKKDICEAEEPALLKLSDGHFIACHFGDVSPIVNS